MDQPDRFGFDRDGGRIAGAVRRFVPGVLAKRGVRVSVSADRREIRAGEPVGFSVTIENRLPVSVAVPTPTRRLWSWGVDGLREATEERVAPSGSGELRLRARERRVIRREWNGLVGRETDGRTRWEAPEPGTHELAAWIDTEPPCARDQVTIRVV